jgi:hypothetical protein
LDRILKMSLGRGVAASNDEEDFSGDEKGHWARL